MGTSKRPPAWRRQSYVYAIGGADQNFVKIGFSTDPKGRCRDLQTANPGPVGILWMADGGILRETALHEYFADHHVRGEWFGFPDGNAVALISEAFAEMYPRPIGVQLQPWTAPPEPSKPHSRPEPPEATLTLSDGTTMTYGEVMDAIAEAEAAHPRPRVTPEESWAAVLQHLRDEGSHC
jgi:hypothetical protein